MAVVLTHQPRLVLYLSSLLYPLLLLYLLYLLLQLLLLDNLPLASAYRHQSSLLLTEWHLARWANYSRVQEAVAPSLMSGRRRRL